MGQPSEIIGSRMKRCFWASLPGYALLVLIHSRAPWLHGASLRENSDPMPYDLILLQTGILAYLFAIFFATLYSLPSQAVWHGVRRHAVVLALVGSLAVPVNSSDVFAYIGFGRIVAIHRANPYDHSYREFSDDYSPYAWFTGSMPYGPVFLPFAGIAGLISQWNVLAAVIFFKATWFALYLITLWFMAHTKTFLRNILFFACNPLMILELLSNAHNDAIIVLCLAAAVHFSFQRRFGLAFFIGTLAAMTKLPLAVVLGPILVLATRCKAWRAITFYVLGITVLAIAMFFANPLERLMSVINPRGVTSTASIQVQALKLAATPDQETLVRFVFGLMYGVFYVWRLRRVQNDDSFLREMAYVVLGLLVYSTQFQPWYVSWFLVLAALSNSRRLLVLGSAISISAISLYGLRYSDIVGIPALRLLRVALLYLIPSAAVLVLVFYQRRHGVDH